MRIETKNYRVDFHPNDKFVALLRVDPSIFGGTVVVGDFMAGTFAPKRNSTFSWEDLEQVTEILKKLQTQVKW